jgi:hypothetical protein
MVCPLQRATSNPCTETISYQSTYSVDSPIRLFHLEEEPVSEISATNTGTYCLYNCYNSKLSVNPCFMKALRVIPKHSQIIKHVFLPNINAALSKRIDNVFFYGSYCTEIKCSVPAPFVRANHAGTQFSNCSPSNG